MQDTEMMGKYGFRILNSWAAKPKNANGERAI